MFYLLQYVIVPFVLLDRATGKIKVIPQREAQQAFCIPRSVPRIKRNPSASESLAALPA
jgi:hypothetical protein